MADLTFPDWYEGGFHNAEDVFCALLQKWFNDCTPAPKAVTWLAPNSEENLPVVRVWRRGGRRSAAMDHPVLQVSVIAETRDEAQRLADFIRELVNVFKGGVVLPNGEKALIEDISDNQGPTQMPEIPGLMDRLVVNYYDVNIKRPTSRPDYARLLRNM